MRLYVLLTIQEVQDQWSQRERLRCSIVFVTRPTLQMAYFRWWLKQNTCTPSARAALWERPPSGKGWLCRAHSEKDGNSIAKLEDTVQRAKASRWENYWWFWTTDRQGDQLATELLWQCHSKKQRRCERHDEGGASYVTSLQLNKWTTTTLRISALKAPSRGANGRLHRPLGSPTITNIPYLKPSPNIYSPGKSFFVREVCTRIYTKCKWVPALNNMELLSKGAVHGQNWSRNCMCFGNVLLQWQCQFSCCHQWQLTLGSNTSLKSLLEKEGPKEAEQ